MSLEGVPTADMGGLDCVVSGQRRGVIGGGVRSCLLTDGLGSGLVPLRRSTRGTTGGPGIDDSEDRGAVHTRSQDGADSPRGSRAIRLTCAAPSPKKAPISLSV